MAGGAQVWGWVSRAGMEGSWLRPRREAEKLMSPLCFTAHHPQLELSYCGAKGLNHEVAPLIQPGLVVNGFRY